MKALIYATTAIALGGTFGVGSSLVRNKLDEKNYALAKSGASLKKGISLLNWSDNAWSEVTPKNMSVTENKRWCLSKLKNKETSKARFLGRCTNLGTNLRLSFT